MAHPIQSKFSLGFRQAKGIFNIYLQEGLAYRASAMIWILTDLVTAFTMPLVWLAATKTQGDIAGFSGSDFVAYYVAMLFLANFITCHFMWDINNEVRDGVLSSQLVRPVNWLKFMFARNLAWRTMRTIIFLPWFVLFIVSYSSHMGQVSYSLGWMFWVSVVLGHMVSFYSVMALATLSLFTEEAQSIFELYYFPMLFLSGQLFPVAVLPAWAQKLALLFPFYYTTGAPTEILIGRLAGDDALRAIGIQLLWAAIAYGAFQFIWPRGLKRYSGVGM